MRWELQRILPFPVEEGIFDYAPLPDSSVMQPDAGMTGSGEAARRRYAVSGGLGEAVDRRMAMLRQMGIRPAALEPEWVTLWRLATDLHAGDGVPCGVVDLGAGGTRLFVVDAAGVPVAFHRSPVGGRVLDQELASMLGTSTEEAERLKTTEFAADLGPLASSRALGELAGDLARALRRVQQEVGSVTVELWAVGGGALWPALREVLTEALGLQLLLPGTSEAAARSPVGALDPRWVLAGELARWHFVRRRARQADGRPAGTRNRIQAAGGAKGSPSR